MKRSYAVRTRGVTQGRYAANRDAALRGILPIALSRLWVHRCHLCLNLYSVLGFVEWCAMSLLYKVDWNLLFKFLETFGLPDSTDH